MTEPAPLSEPQAQAQAQAVAKIVARRRRGVAGWFITVLVGLVLLVAAVGLVGRFAVLTPQGRLFLEARTNGLDLGRIGKLRIEGLAGDIWHEFAIRRLTISDEHGVWLEAHGLDVAWRPAELFARRLHVSSVSAADLRILRRPTLTPKTKDNGLPVSIAIDKLQTKLETLPAFSTEHGLFNVAGGFKVERLGGASGQIKADSLVHTGDGLAADFQYGKGKAVRLNAKAVESQGGAIAGSLGLPSKLPFSLDAKVNGTLAAGTLNLIARSGATTPLQATGGWNGQGAQADGRLDLSSSSLMKGVLAMFGPVAEVHVNARHTPAGLYDGSVKVQTDNLGLSASGGVKLETRSAPAGLAFEADVKDLSKITSIPAMKAGTFKGRLAGSLSDLDAKGAVNVSTLSLGGYNLAQAAGSLDVHFAKKVLTIKSDLNGTGGTGEGLFAAWMGPQPKASVTLDREPNGVFLIRTLQATGAGMKIDATGSRTLLGGYAFDGQAELSNLGAAYKGATGVLTAQMSIRHEGADQPWKFTADAKGANFATGYDAIDRLLGKTPHLIAAAERASGGAWTITKGDLDGEQASGAATGQFGPDNALKLAVNWRAKGPFEAGPVEITGGIKGDGQVTGTIGQPRAELTADIAAIDLPRLPLKDAKLNLTFARGADDSNGAVKLVAASDYGPAQVSANFKLTQTGLDLSNLDARAGGATAAGQLALRDGQPSHADLTLTLAKGAFLDQGTVNAKVSVTDAAGGAAGHVAVTASNLGFGAGDDLVIRSASLTGDGPLAKMPFTLKTVAAKAGVPIIASGSGVATQTGQAYAVSFNGQGQYRKTVVKTLDPLVVNFGGPELSAKGSLSLGGGRADIEARQDDDAMSVHATLAGVELSIIDQDLAGKFNANLTATGKGKQLSGDLTAALTEARSRDGPRDAAINANVTGSLRGDKLTVSAAAANQDGLKSSASLTLPAEASAAPFRIAINRKKPMDGKFDLDGELQPVWDLFFGGERTLGGRLVAQGTLGGSLGDPRLTGQATLANGRFEDSVTGLKLRNVAIAATLDQDAVTVTKFNGTDSKTGTLSGSGRVSLERAGASTFSLTADKFLLISNDLATASASGAVTVTRDADGKAALKGKLTIDRADVVANPPTPSGVTPMEVVEINLPEGREITTVDNHARGPAFALDVTLAAPQKIFVKGKGLDAELSLDAHVSGTTAAPVLTGSAKVIRGSYDFAGKRFEIDTGGTVYLATAADKIRLDLSATNDDPSLTAVIKVTGTAAKPDIKLTSTPVLPNDEVLAQVLFGKSVSQLSPLEAAQMASALTGLATGGGFDVIGGLKSLAGLDRLALSGGDSTSGGVSVSGGKYITDNVYLELTGGGREGPSAQVEWRVRKSLSIISRLATGTGDSMLSVRWRREYGKKSQTKPAP